MLKIDNVVLPSVAQWDAIIRGMRNPKNSWGRSDSYWDSACGDDYLPTYVVGNNDMTLMKTLVSGGPVHAKFRRMIVVYLDVTAPLLWWKEYDTYKISTVANSCSTMHKITEKEFTLDDFSHEHLDDISLEALQKVIHTLNIARENYIENSEERHKALKITRKDDWWQLIQLLPSSYNQRRTLMLNYEVLSNIYKWRRHHKLDEWHTFCDWIETLPYAKELIIGEKGDD